MNRDGIGKAINYFQLWLIWMLLQRVYWRWYDAVVNRHHKISVEQIYGAAVSMGWNVYQLVGSVLGKVVKIKRYDNDENNSFFNKRLATIKVKGHFSI